MRKALDAVETARQQPSGDDFGGVSIPAKSTLDPKRLEAVLGAHGQVKGGMVKFVLERTTKAHGVTLGADMGVNTWAAFAGAPQAAVVDGDFAMRESELQAVLRALRAARIHVVAIHSHMTHEEPRILFLHFWGKGPSEDLARRLKTAMDTQSR